jgi:hypothetical protein
MSQMLPAAHAIGVLAVKLPEPATKFTVPIIVVFALLALLAIARKVIGLALIALIVAGVFIAYQAGAFNQWVDKGKEIIQQQSVTR